MRTASSRIGDIIDKIREDDVKETAELETPSKPAVVKSLADMHPASLDGKFPLAVVINAILMFRDKYRSMGEKEARKLVEHVVKLNGMISDQSSENFHLSFSTRGDNISVSIYDTYIDYSNKKWYMRFHVIFPAHAHGIGKYHVFPIVEVKTGVNHSQMYWDSEKNEPLCQSSLKEIELKALFDYAASIEYNMGLKKMMVDVNKYVKPEVKEIDYTKIDPDF